MNPCRSRSFSSVEVVSHCDDLVTEILLRLPLYSVFKFKCVSKTWNRLISDPIFCSNYQSQRKNSLLPLLGFFRVTKDQKTNKISFLQNCKERKFTKLDYFEKYCPVYAPPEGLLLCSVDRFRDFKYIVCNPVTNQWFSLPKPNHEYIPSSVCFSCEECTRDGDGVVHFKVMLTLHHEEERDTYDTLRVETFSSRTGEWSESFLTSPSEFSPAHRFGCKSLSVGGIFYWEVSGHFAAYDPDMGGNRLWLIKLPPRVCKTQVCCMNYLLGQSPDGCLRFAINDKHQFRVWDLKKKLSSYSLCHTIPSREWILKEVVSYKMLNLCRPNKFYPRLKAFHPHNSKLVLLQRGSLMFCYEFETRRLERIQYRGTLSPSDKVIPYFQPSWCPSMPPLHNV